jgi:acyl-coenzyme A synthetase/AMP-(fatty) acid ligase
VFATWIAGGVLVPINAGVKQDKLAYLLADSGATALVADARLAPVWMNVLSADPEAISVVVCSGELGEFAPIAGDVAMRSRTWLSFDTVMVETEENPTDPGTIPTDLAAILYTSGSTGAPKGVMVTHQSVRFICNEVSAYLGLRKDDRILSALSLAFGYGLYQLLLATEVGATILLESGFVYPTSVIAQIRAEGVTVFPAVPTMLSTLRAQAGIDPLSAVRIVTSAGAALPAELVPSLKLLFPRADVFAMYGQTECKRVCFLDPVQLECRPGSVGRAMRGTQTFILDSDGEPVGVGETGILYVRGPHVMVGYWNKPEETARVLRVGTHPGDRVLCTRDWFRMDEDGYLYFVSRSDDIIKTRGEKVSPTEVENVIYGIEGVLEAAVVGVPDEVFGEEVVAFIVAQSGVVLNERLVKRVCHEKLESYMVPTRVAFVDALPKTENGKIRTLDLRDQPTPLDSRRSSNG